MTFNKVKSLIGDIVANADGEVVNVKDWVEYQLYESGVNPLFENPEEGGHMDVRFPCAGIRVKDDNRVVAVITFDSGRGGDFFVFDNAKDVDVINLARKVCAKDFNVEDLY